MTVYIIYKKHIVSEVSIMGYCDGIESITKSMYQETTFSCLSNHFGMLSAIDSKLKASPIQWKWIHIKVRQGNNIGPL